MPVQIKRYEKDVVLFVKDDRAAKILEPIIEEKEIIQIKGFDPNNLIGDFKNYVGQRVNAKLFGAEFVSFNVSIKSTIQESDKEGTELYQDEVFEDGDKKIFVARDLSVKIDAFKHLFTNKLYEYCNFLLYGHSGFGKTTIAKHLARILNLKQVKIDMGGITNPVQLIGYDGITNGNTGFKINTWIDDMQAGNALVILDELDKTNNPQVWAMLNPILDGGRELSFRDYRIKIGENVAFVGTINHQWADTASQEISASLASRFHFRHESEALPPHLETELLSSLGVKKSAEKIVEVINKLRLGFDEGAYIIEVSTRKTEFLARLIANGYSIRMAFDMVYTSQISKEKTDEILHLNTVLDANFGKIKYDKLHRAF